MEEVRLDAIIILVTLVVFHVALEPTEKRDLGCNERLMPNYKLCNFCKAALAACPLIIYVVSIQDLFFVVLSGF